MKNSLQTKLYASIISAMIFSASGNAQIVYTDIVPDKTLSYGIYDLDLNNDGQSDFTFKAWYSFLSCGGQCSVRLDTTQIKPTGLSWVSDTVNGQAAKLNSGDSINASSQLWRNYLRQLLYNKNADCSLPLNFCLPQGAFTSPHQLPSAGIWVNVADKYLALKIQVSGNFYYGWARLDAGSEGIPITIKDYAFNSIPNQPILAGDTGTGPTGTIENIASSINLFPNPANNHLTIVLGSNSKKTEVTIADITGKIIYTTTATDVQKLEINTTNFLNGIYVVRIQSADFIGTKKLVIEK